MYRFSFKIRHTGCSETGLSLRFPKHHITVLDIQSRNPKEKQYFYHLTGNPKDFDAIIDYLRSSDTYKLTKEIERTSDTLLLVVVLRQPGFIQNTIQKYHGFFIDLHTVHGGYEYWHVGAVDQKAIRAMRDGLRKAGELTTLYLGKVDFGNAILSKQQLNVVRYALEQGYYEQPRKTTVARIAKALRLNPATVGEHLLKAENKLIKLAAKRL